MTPIEASGLNCTVCNNSFPICIDKDLIRVSSLGQGEQKEETLCCSKIFFVTRGNGVLHLGKSKKIHLRKGQFILLPIGTDYKLIGITDLCISGFTIDEMITTADIADYIDPSVIPGKPVPALLEMHEKLWMFVTTTVEFLNDGLSCSCYKKMKIKELLHVLRVYYSPESLGEFFIPLYSKVPAFSMTVYENWNKVDNLQELAEMTGLSLSGFSKKFNRIFGVSPYRWIMDKKGEIILHELFNGNKSIRQLTEEYGFYSVQHFGYYCKKHLGYSPGKIRRYSRKNRNNRD